MSEPRAIAIVRSGQAYNAYDALLQALLKRRNELGVSGETLDDITGQPTRYSQKLLDGTRMFGRKSFGDMLGGLAVQIVIIEDEDALKLIKDRLEQSPLNESSVRIQANACMVVPRWLFGSRKASKAGKKRWKGVSKEKRSRHARKAIKARWSKPRIVDITQTELGRKLVKGTATLSRAPGAQQEMPNPSAQLAAHSENKSKRAR